MSQQTINTPRDTTLQATNTALGLLAKDATIGATNTALGLLGKDASLQDIKTALLQIVAALDPTADDYDQLSNKPQVNGVTLSGNKTSKQLGIRQTIPLTSAQYAQLSSAEKMDVDKDYIITDENATAAPIDDDSVSRNKVWSSYKVDEELDTLNSKLAQTDSLLVTNSICSKTYTNGLPKAIILSTKTKNTYVMDGTIYITNGVITSNFHVLTLSGGGAIVDGSASLSGNTLTINMPSSTFNNEYLNIVEIF